MIEKYIQDPNNPNASIPNPDYVLPVVKPTVAPDTSVINTTNTRPTPDVPFVSPAVSPIPPVAGLGATPPQELTPPETKAQTITEQLQALNQSLIGESAYRTEQEKAQDITGLTKTRTDLANQLKMLQNEALAIPQQMQIEATGRGITAGGLAPLQTARLRTNAIAALGVSALSEAANGNLAMANDLVDRAVAAKFDPIREEINAAIANLNLILKSPEYTLAEKNRAQVQLDAQNAKKDALDLQRAEQKSIWDIGLVAAQNRADAVTLQKIQKATTKEEALQIATQAGVFIQPKEVATSIIEANGRKLLVNTATGEVIKDFGSVKTFDLEKVRLKEASDYFRDWKTQHQYIQDPNNPNASMLNTNWDGYVDPNDYQRMREYFATEIGSVAKFDKTFSSLLSPQERDRLGVGKESYTPPKAPKEKEAPPTTIGSVKALMSNNASLKDITDYINFSGYNIDSSQFQEILKGYSPKVDKGLIRWPWDY